MSSVRKCDVQKPGCWDVFSELADGWQTFQSTMVVKNPDTKRRESVQMNLDACPNCAIGTPDGDPPSARRDNDRFFETEQLRQRVKELEAAQSNTAAAQAESDYPAQPVTPAEDAATT